MASTDYRVFWQDNMIADRVRVAFRFVDRLRGLLGGKPLVAGAGLWLKPGGSVHTVGMSFPIDVLFLDVRFQVVGVRSRVPPGKLCLAPRFTHSTLELWSGACDAWQLKRGMQLEFQRVPR